MVDVSWSEDELAANLDHVHDLDGHSMDVIALLIHEQAGKTVGLNN